MQGSLLDGLHKRQWTDFQPVLDVWNIGTLVGGITTSNGSPTVTTSGTFLGLAIGMQVVGTNIPPGTAIQAIASATSLTLTQNATGTNTLLLIQNVSPFLGSQQAGASAIGRYLYVPEWKLCHFEFILGWGSLITGPTAVLVAGSNTITTAGNFWTGGVQPGMMIIDGYPSTKVPPYTYVQSINAAGTSLVMSQPAATLSAGETVFFQGHGGAGYYLVKLPVPARLQMGGMSGNALPNIADRFLGSGHVAQSFNENPNVPVEYMPGDYAGLSYGGRRQDWTQAFCPYIRAQGSSNVPLSGTSATVDVPVRPPHSAARRSHPARLHELPRPELLVLLEPDGDRLHRHHAGNLRGSRDLRLGPHDRRLASDRLPGALRPRHARVRHIERSVRFHQRLPHLRDRRLKGSAMPTSFQLPPQFVQRLIAYASIVMGVLTTQLQAIHLSPTASLLLGGFGILLHPDVDHDADLEHQREAPRRVMRGRIQQRLARASTGAREGRP